MIQNIAPHQYDVTYRKTAVQKGDIMLIYKEDELLCNMAGTEIAYPTAEEIAAVCPEIWMKAKFLFRIDETNYFELRNRRIAPFGRWTYIHKEQLRAVRPIWRSFAALTGFQIHNWYTNTQFCGRCGNKMTAQGEERAMMCNACGRLYYPQICPSVIVGIINGDRLLMTKYASSHSSYKKYTLVAGYAEVGESLEDTVCREAMEEVGLRVKNIRYYKSQPWSYSDTLLVGFFCDVDGNAEISMDGSELSAAKWFERTEIPEECLDPISLTGEMIAAFREGLLV